MSWRSAFGPHRHRNVCRRPLVSGQKTTFSGDFGSSVAKELFSSPGFAGQHKPDRASFPPGDRAGLPTALTTSLRPGTLWDRSRAE